jgi:hypothetical protein
MLRQNIERRTGRGYAATRVGALAFLLLGNIIQDVSPIEAQAQDRFESAPGPVYAAPRQAPRSPPPRTAPKITAPVERSIAVPVPEPALAPPQSAAPMAVVRPPPPTQRAAYDGVWWTIINCPNHSQSNALEWTRAFTSQVTNGTIHAQDGGQGQPNYLSMDGNILPDGTAELIVHGLTGNDPRFGSYNPRPATAYAYQITARFQGSRGAGTRTTGRPCSAQFIKR